MPVVIPTTCANLNQKNWICSTPDPSLSLLFPKHLRGNMTVTRRGAKGEGADSLCDGVVAGAKQSASLLSDVGMPASTARFNGENNSEDDREVENTSTPPLLSAQEYPVDSDDDAPDVEVTSVARARKQQVDAAVQAARAERKAARRARSQAREVVAAARKREDDVKGKEKARFLSDEALERAAEKMEEDAAIERENKRAKRLRVQSGTLRVAKTQRVVDGIKVVDASVPASRRVAKSKGSTGQDAMRFLKSCMYGSGTPRVSAEEAARKVRGVRQIRKAGRERHPRQIGRSHLHGAKNKEQQ
jgi:hypothetical protein